MFRLYSNYISSVLDLCFDCARPMFWLCSTYVSTFSTKSGYVPTVFDLKLLVDRGILFAKLLVLGFQIRKIIDGS